MKFVVLVIFEKNTAIIEYGFEIDTGESGEWRITDLGIRRDNYSSYGLPIVGVELTGDAFDWFLMNASFASEPLPEFGFVVFIPNVFRDDDRVSGAAFYFDAIEQQPELIGIVQDAALHQTFAVKMLNPDWPAFILAPYVSLQ